MAIQTTPFSKGNHRYVPPMVAYIGSIVAALILFLESGPKRC